MTRLPAVLALAAAVVALTAAPASAQGDFQWGTAASEITATSAVVWTRVPNTQTSVLVRYFPKKAKKPSRTVDGLTATAEHDQTVEVRLTKLKPDTVYQYQFAQGGASSLLGTFRTAPRATKRKRVRFTYSGDADAQPATPGGPPFYNRFEVYARMARERNAFAINIGDTIYSDTEVGSSVEGGAFQPAGPPALTLADKWAKYKQNLLPNLLTLRRNMGVYNHWDDHEFINDFSPQGYLGDVYPAGVQAFRDYMPVTYSAERGIYRKFRWGRNVELFFPDARSFRSTDSKLDCINPASKLPDFAPTAPQTTRSAFGLVAPSLNEPVSEACKASIADPARTMLGATQLARLLRDVKASKATFKVIVNEVPMMDLVVFPYDAWGGYAAERTKLLQGLRNVKNVVFITTDTHAAMIGEIATDRLGANRRSGISEAIAGPVATMTYAKEIAGALGSPDGGDTLETAFFSPPPPSGLGLPCVNLDVYSYGVVDVRRKRLTVTIKDINGRAVRHLGSGAACKPLVVRAR